MLLFLYSEGSGKRKGEGKGRWQRSAEDWSTSKNICALGPGPMQFVCFENLIELQFHK